MKSGLYQKNKNNSEEKHNLKTRGSKWEHSLRAIQRSKNGKLDHTALNLLNDKKEIYKLKNTLRFWNG